MEFKIYSMKAKRPGSAVNGRFKATDVRDATKQAAEYLQSWGDGWEVQITVLKNQAAAMAKWDKK